MPIKCIIEDGLERCFVNDAPTNEDCESLAKYFEKYWLAEVRRVYDVGTNAHYKMRIRGKRIDLKHASGEGNFLSSLDGDVSDILKDAIEDLDFRLGR